MNKTDKTVINQEREKILGLYHFYKRGFEYEGNIVRVDEEVWRTPLIDLTYGRVDFPGNNQLVPANLHLPLLVTIYRGSKGMANDKNLTLEDAIKEI